MAISAGITEIPNVTPKIELHFQFPHVKLHETADLIVSIGKE